MGKALVRDFTLVVCIRNRTSERSVRKSRTRALPI